MVVIKVLLLGHCALQLAHQTAGHCRLLQVTACHSFCVLQHATFNQVAAILPMLPWISMYYISPRGRNSLCAGRDICLCVSVLSTHMHVKLSFSHDAAEPRHLSRIVCDESLDRITTIIISLSPDENIVQLMRRAAHKWESELNLLHFMSGSIKVLLRQ